MDEWIMERYTLAKERVAQIRTEKTVKEPYRDFFQRTAGFLTKTSEILEAGEQDKTLEELEAENRALYEELFSENYGTCYGNPAYAAERLGEYGKAFTFYMQSFGAALPMHLKKSGGILLWLLSCFWRFMRRLAGKSFRKLRR